MTGLVDFRLQEHIQERLNRSYTHSELPQQYEIDRDTQLFDQPVETVRPSMYHRSKKFFNARVKRRLDYLSNRAR